MTVTQKAISGPLAAWPLTLNTGRYRDQWHSMTRTGLAPKLARHREEPLVEVHPDDAAGLGVIEGGLAWVATPQGDSLYRVRVTPAQRRARSSRRSTGPTAPPAAGEPACCRVRWSIRCRASRASSKPRRGWRR
ncbi:hypothetical protein GCM10020258_20940 [Sphingomonas yabuuchiae]